MGTTDEEEDVTKSVSQLDGGEEKAGKSTTAETEK